LYLRSTIIEFEGNIFIQKKEVCIGIKAAPKISELCLGKKNREVLKKIMLLDGMKESDFLLKRFVDDYMLRAKTKEISENICKLFEENGKGLIFTKDEALDNWLQFLDLKIKITDNGLCWKFAQRTVKSLLPFSSHHSNLIKKGMIENNLRSVEQKSCEHLNKESLDEQMSRFRDAGFPEWNLEDAIRKICVEKRGKKENEYEEKKCSVVPFDHDYGHSSRKIAKIWNVNVAFNYPNKLSKISRLTTTEKDECVHKGDEFVRCRNGVVYDIPLL
jgi:hypothetical protein